MIVSSHPRSDRRASDIRGATLDSHDLGITDLHDTTIEVCNVHNMRLEVVHPSRKEDDRVINHLDDGGQSPESTEYVASYHSRGTVKSLGTSVYGNRILAMVNISGTMDQDAMTTER